jgi:hypothetical protein
MAIQISGRDHLYANHDVTFSPYKWLEIIHLLKHLIFPIIWWRNRCYWYNRILYLLNLALMQYWQSTQMLRLVIYCQNVDFSWFREIFVNKPNSVMPENVKIFNKFPFLIYRKIFILPCSWISRVNYKVAGFPLGKIGVRVMVLNVTFNNISAILWWLVHTQNRVMVFNVTFNNISAILWWLVHTQNRVMVFNVAFNNISVVSWRSLHTQWGLGLWCLTPLIFTLYRGGHYTYTHTPTHTHLYTMYMN